ncbi:uncharacterized protein LOC110999334 [Pieris rapae]|uniref:uncharacterized protein LOC110999334 n=1 Tax=Pieris rapae TaxID=64459 RepID=UPI001E2804B8|nr:uncharacterized protein LOC110999334 [Pieris rapae]
MSKKYLFFYVMLIVNFQVNSQHCQKLHDVYHKSPKKALRHVRIDKQEYEVIVSGGGGAARAAAALLLAVLRNRLLYVSRLDPVHRNVCELMTKSLALAPAAILNHKDCGIGNDIDRITSLSTPSLPVNLHFMARLSTTSGCIIESWTFLKNNNASTCGFLTTENVNVEESQGKFSKHCNQSPCIVVLTRNESSYDNQILQEFEKRASVAKLNVALITFDTDTSFRREVFNLYNSNKTYLFIDENIWINDPDVVQLEFPPCPRADTKCLSGLIVNAPKAILVGDGEDVKDYAPPIYKLMNEFSPKPEHIKDVLLKESMLDTHSIEEAACFWALRNKIEFDKWYKIKEKKLPPEYLINLIICKNDSNIEIYKKVSEVVNINFLWRDIKELDYRINAMPLNCTNIHELRIALSYKQNDLAGHIVFGWHPGLAGGSNAVQYTQIPLMVAGPANDSLLGGSTYASSGRLTDLTRAYRHFLYQCEWSRVAIISDFTEYSKSFAEAILSERNLNHFQITVGHETISQGLREMKSRDARIIIVNTDCILADAILSEVVNVFSPLTNYVWIVRDWCVIENRTKIEALVHFTIEFSWRGGKVFGGSNELRLNLSEIPVLMQRNITIVPEISYLADALLQLGHGFAAYRRRDISRRYDLHGFGTAQDYYEAIGTVNVTGVAQTLKLNNFSVQEPLVFVGRWTGNERTSVAIWKLTNSTVVKIWAAINDTDSCYSMLGSAKISDRDNCIVRSDGDFTPRCHDVFIIVIITCVLFICIAIYVAQRMRQKRLLAENEALMARLLESRQEKASALIGFLVDRGSVRLLHEIGSGCYGRVRFAELTRPGRGTLVVAAKELHEGVLSMAEENEILREACVLARLEHNNVIRLMGVCLVDGPPLVLMEHAIYLDLQRYLIERRHVAMKLVYDKEADNEMSDECLNQWARDAACALEYLTERRLVHRDIRAANCLIDKKRSLKLADFGMARELDEEDSTYMTCRKGLFPVLWMAPESLKEGVFSLASDIWATGVLLLEIATIGARPYGDWPTWRVLSHVVDGGRPPLPPDASMQMRKLLQRCWHMNPEKRITATELREYLTNNPKVISIALLSPELPLIAPIQEADIKFLT